MLADDEDRHFPEVGHAFGIDVVQPLEVHVAEADDIAELAQLDPIENAAADITRALERVLTAAHHRDRMLAWLELVHQRAVVRVAEQGATDGRWVQVRGVEVDESVLHLLCRRLVDAFALGALERLVDVALGQVQAADRAVAGQLAPGCRLVIIRADGGRFLRDARLALHQPQRHRDVMRRAHDDLVDHHHRDGGTSDRIDGDRILVPRTADNHALVNVDTLVLGIEGVQLFFGDADQQDRFMVLEHVGIDDHALRVEQHLHVDGFAGIGGDVHHVDGLEGIAKDLVALGDRADLVVALSCRDACAGEELVEALLLGCIFFGLQRRCADAQDQQNEKALDPGTEHTGQRPDFTGSHRITCLYGWRKRMVGERLHPYP